MCWSKEFGVYVFFCKKLNQCKNTNFSAVVHTCGCGSLFVKTYCYHSFLCNVHAGAAKILLKLMIWLSIKVYTANIYRMVIGNFIGNPLST